jgi:hypothetical protein
MRSPRFWTSIMAQQDSPFGFLSVGLTQTDRGRTIRTIVPMKRPIFFNPLRKKADRLARLAEEAARGGKNYDSLTPLICANSAIEAARRAGTIDQRAADMWNIRAGEAFRDQSGPAFASGTTGFHQITNAGDWSAVPGGCFVAFLGTMHGARVLSHVMVSLGNGRAAGSNNGPIGEPADWRAINVGQSITWQDGLAHCENRDFEVWVRDLEDQDSPDCVIQ